MTNGEWGMGNDGRYFCRLLLWVGNLDQMVPIVSETYGVIRDPSVLHGAAPTPAVDEPEP